MQVLDEEYLGADFEFGGVDQRKIFMFGIDNLPRIGYNKTRCYLMNPMIHSLSKEGKMSASDPKTKIDLLDSPEEITVKCQQAHSVDRQVDGNGVLELFKYIVFQMPEYASGLTVTRPEKYGGYVHFTTYSELESAFVEGSVASIDLKVALGRELAQILAPLRRCFLEQHTDLIRNAYPL